MSYVLDRRRLHPDFDPAGWGSGLLRQARGRITGFDIALVIFFLLGLYTNYTIEISTKVPFPSAPSGIAGLFLLWRRRDQLTPRAVSGLVAVLALYVISVLVASDITFLHRRTNGLIQLTYSIVIGYALFLTVTSASRRQVEAIFLGFAIVVLIGCLLEDYTGLKDISDKAREIIYRKGIYENDLRDLALYNRIRPKFFASEPSSVTFCFSVFTFVWFTVSRWRWKMILYVAMVGIGIFAMPGPTLLLMLILILPYMLFLRSRIRGRLNGTRFLQALIVATLCGLAFVVLAQTVFSERLRDITAGNDPSFFYRVQGPALAARDVLKDYPFAGAGLTGEPFIERQVVNLYVMSPAYSAHWTVVSPATELLINYFWLHWIYLGIVFGTIMIIAVSLWLRILGVPSLGFCWMAWSILGQASGAYVGPTCWAVLFLMGAAAIFHQREELPVESWQPLATGGFYGYGGAAHTGTPSPPPVGDERHDPEEPDDTGEFHALTERPRPDDS